MDTPAARRRPLPIGIQSFAKLREGGCCYVDKTGLAIDLIESSAKYLLFSRPPGFGKTLLLDMLKELFEGNRPLFDGLAAETRWDWSKRYPVIHLSFANSTAAHPEALRQEIRALLDQHGARLGVFGHDHDQDTDRSISSRFATLIAQAHRQHGRRVVVLVDGYTQPAAARLDDPVQAQAMCDVLMDLYSVFKGSDEHLEFVLLVGMGRFRPPGLRSDLNQTLNLTQDSRWSGLCGFTDEELETVFAPEMAGIDSAALHRWHGGYQWGKDGVRVVHPVDALRVLADRKVEHHRTEPDAITALVSRMLAAERCFTPDLDAWHTGYMSLSVFEIDRIPAGTLLFHTGHLSVRSVRRSEHHEFITLGYPNLDIQISLNRSLLSAYGVPLRTALDARLALLDALKAARLPAVVASLQTLFAGIPGHWYATHPLGEFDGHGASVFYSHLAALGLDLRVEDATNHGRIDLTLTFGGQVFLFEFKVVDDQPDGSALAQIRAKGYADKYRDTGRTVHLVGIEFSRAARNVVGFEVETLG